MDRTNEFVKAADELRNSSPLDRIAQHLEESIEKSRMIDGDVLKESLKDSLSKFRKELQSSTNRDHTILVAGRILSLEEELTMIEEMQGES